MRNKLLNIIIVSCVFIMSGCSNKVVENTDNITNVEIVESTREQDIVSDIKEQEQDTNSTKEFYTDVETEDSTEKSSEESTDAKYEEVVVELTMDNVNDYIEVIIVDEVNSWGEKTGLQYPLSVSKVYDSGLILKRADNFVIEYQFPESTSTMPAPYDYVGWAGKLGEPTIIRVTGTLIFVEEKYVTEYKIENQNRKVKFSNGSSSGGYIWNEDYLY